MDTKRYLSPQFIGIVHGAIAGVVSVALFFVVISLVEFMMYGAVL
jgi:hypothetical protein